jgi:mannose-6-phosphate isomerase-like protein (cupin superfamily)
MSSGRRSTAGPSSRADGERLVALEAGMTCIVPRGVWHRAIVREPGDTLHITRGEGTQHRPR